MDVDWAESQMPSTEVRGGERKLGSAHLTLAPITQIDAAEDGEGHDAIGLCADARCVQARSERRAQRSVKVELDLDALSAALAAALVTALDGRELATPTRPAMQAVVAAPAVKRSFWAGAWHADVVLSSIAILVVVIVLLAWTV